MKLTILGTGNAMVTKCYNTCFAIEQNDEYFLVDGGGGNQIISQLEKANIDWKKHISTLTILPVLYGWLEYLLRI